MNYDLGEWFLLRSVQTSLSMQIGVHAQRQFKLGSHQLTSDLKKVYFLEMHANGQSGSKAQPWTCLTAVSVLYRIPEGECVSWEGGGVSGILLASYWVFCRDIAWTRFMYSFKSLLTLMIEIVEK